MEYTVDERVVRVARRAGVDIEVQPLADGRRYRLSRGTVFAYVYTRQGYIRGVARRSAVVPTGFGDWDRELPNEFWGAPGVEVRVADSDAGQEARLVEMLRRLAAAARPG